MAKRERDDLIRALITGAAIVAGTVAVAKILEGVKARTGPKFVPCPNCNNQIAENASPCPHCGVQLTWSHPR